MTKDPEWFEEEANKLFEKWSNEDTKLDFPEYLESNLSERGRKYLIAYREHRKKMFDERLAV